MNNYEYINDVIVKLFRDILYLEEEAMRGTEYKDLTMNDWHVIEAIGMDEPKSMSSIAKELCITVGSLTTAMNGLYKKGYVNRNRGEADRRLVYISLTEKGEKAYRYHADFHRDMVRAAVADQTPEEIEVLVGSLSKLTKFFRSFGK